MCLCREIAASEMMCSFCSAHEAIIKNAVKTAVNATLDGAIEKLKDKLWLAGVSESSIQIAAEALNEFRQ